MSKLAEVSISNRARSLKRLERRPLLSQSVQEEIRAYIIENALQPGSALPSEADFAKQLSVSRNSVREAVKSLQSLGLIEARVGSGLFVRAFSMDVMLDNLPFNVGVNEEDFSQAFAAREYLELGMADDVVHGVTVEQLEQLRAVITAWRAQAKSNRYPSQLDLEFHKTLATVANNGVVSRLLEILWEVRNRARQAGAIPRTRDPQGQFERHEAIFKALERRDAATYRKAVAGHYQGSRQEMESGPQGENDGPRRMVRSRARRT